MHNGSRGKKTFERGAGDGVLAYLPQTRGILESPRGEYVLGVSLFFPIDIFLDLFNINGLLLRTSLPLTSRNRRGAAFYHQAKFEPETHLVLRQILQCPYDGEVRKLFMEAKSLELVALKLAELGPAKLGDVSELKKREMEQVREAYQIILESLADPPSLMQLSRVVGLNRNKLNQGFKKLYGDTVFNVLRNARLAKASYLLQNTELSLPEIAYSIGYNSQANFTTAFRQHFGQTPKNVRQNGLPRLSHRQIFMT
jgi:AraC-like DNA-binding protein